MLTIPPHTLTVSCCSEPVGEAVIELMAELAQRSSLTILDGGNCFPAYRLLRALRSKAIDLRTTAQRVFVRRAFTCHQMLALLEGTPSRSQPYFLLNPLVTFYDEQVPLPETSRLLDRCLRQVERLAQNAPVLVTVTPPLTPERAEFAERLSACASHLYLPEPPVAHVVQLALF